MIVCSCDRARPRLSRFFQFSVLAYLCQELAISGGQRDWNGNEPESGEYRPSRCRSTAKDNPGQLRVCRLLLAYQPPPVLSAGI
jgi:hypothetical protein